MLRLHQRILQRLGLFFLLPDAFCDLLGHHHYHNVLCIIIHCHNEGLAHANLFSTTILSPVVNVHLRISLGETFFQRIYVYNLLILLHGFLQNELLTFLKIFGSLAGRFQSHLFKQGYLRSVHCAHNILLYQILGQIKFKGTKCIGGDCYPVLPFLAVCKGHFGLDAQFLFLDFRNILADIQNLVCLAVLPLQAYHVHMHPLGTPLTHHMALNTQIILLG